MYELNLILLRKSGNLLKNVELVSVFERLCTHFVESFSPRSLATNVQNDWKNVYNVSKSLIVFVLVWCRRRWDGNKQWTMVKWLTVRVRRKKPKYPPSDQTSQPYHFRFDFYFYLLWLLLFFFVYFISNQLIIFAKMTGWHTKVVRAV